jgi:uncharacterized membrane protein YbaN (DUF454 family)
MIHQSSLSKTTLSKTNAANPRRLLLFGVGYLSFATGFVGMFLPVLPTTIFWIIAAICFAKSSPAMYRRILAWPRIGPVIGEFLNHGVIGRRSKMIALAGMAAAAALILFLGIGAGPAIAALLCIAFAALYVVTRPSSL